MPKSVEFSFDPYRLGVVKLRPRAIMLIEIDKQIERLSGQYQEIIQSRSFQKLKTRQGQIDLAFVCFYVILLTARYLGWRSSEIMRCRLETHDGKFRLVVMEDLKQLPNKRLILSMDAIQPAILRESLCSYAEVVYPFLQTASDHPLSTRFFFSCSRSGIAPFKHSFQFVQQFQFNMYFNMYRFLPLRDSQLPCFYQLRMFAKAASEQQEEFTIEAAQALGDEVETVKKMYASSRKKRTSQ